MNTLETWKSWARSLKKQTLTVYFASRDPETPILVRALAIGVAAYALSPIDLIPDWIPIIGYLDDLIIVPLGLALIVRLTPAHVIARSQERAAELAERPVSYVAACCIVLVWLLALYACRLWFHG